MSEEIRCYQYVNRPYTAVSDAIVRDGGGLFERATHAAVGRAKDLVSTLHVEVAGVDIGKDVVIHVGRVDTAAAAPARMGAATTLDLEWRADKGAALFPTMHATLSLYPLADGETQLDLRGTYDPPGGVFGSVADKLVGKRIAEASVHRFLDDIARRLAEEL
jgi:hypothetical protein